MYYIDYYLKLNNHINVAKYVYYRHPEECIISDNVYDIRENILKALTLIWPELLAVRPAYSTLEGEENAVYHPLKIKEGRRMIEESNSLNHPYRLINKEEIANLSKDIDKIKSCTNDKDINLIKLNELYGYKAI